MPLKTLSYRAKMTRIVEVLLDHPEVKRSPFAPMMLLARPQLTARINALSEADARTAIETLRAILDA